MPFNAPLSPAAMRETLEAIIAGTLPEATIREFLATLARRGETAEEIATAVEVLRAHAVPLPVPTSLALCDTCGTGGDGQGTVNVSTLAALVAAAAGVRIAKHGNRAASSRCGSADLLEALGLNLSASPAQVASCITDLGFGFCFAPVFHPAMKAVAPIRTSLGIRTLFNLVGPLANPARLTFQLVGVSDITLLRPMAEALQHLGLRHALIVHGRDGLDEITTTTPTDALEVRDGRVTPLTINPDTIGIPIARADALRGGSAKDNAAIAREALAGPAPRGGAGKSSAVHDIIAVNAGCAIYVADQAATIQAGVARATDVLSSGRALTLLAQVIERCRHAG